METELIRNAYGDLRRGEGDMDGKNCGFWLPSIRFFCLTINSNSSFHFWPNFPIQFQMRQSLIALGVVCVFFCLVEAGVLRNKYEEWTNVLGNDNAPAPPKYKVNDFKTHEIH